MGIRYNCNEVSVGKTGFVSHTKPTVEATQGSTSFMRDNM